jgi:hypothetical protein
MATCGEIATFDPACDFLLVSDYVSLFEQAHSTDETVFRCKGCRQIVKRWRRLDHWQTHRTLQARQMEDRKAELRLARVENMRRARMARGTRAA